MRIEAYNQVAQLYNREKTAKAPGFGSVSAGRDEVHISSLGRDYQVAKQALAEASDIREDRVAQLKERLDSGNYNVDMDDFANRLLEKYNALRTQFL